MIDQDIDLGQPDRQKYVPVCWCGIGPIGPTGTIIFGAILALGGGVWLLYNLGLITPALLDLLWPLGLMAVGLSYLAWAVVARRSGQ